MNCRPRVGGIAGPLVPRSLDLPKTHLEVLPDFYTVVDDIQEQPAQGTTTPEWHSRVPEVTTSTRDYSVLAEIDCRL